MTVHMTPGGVLYDKSQVFPVDDSTGLFVPLHVQDGTGITLLITVHGWGSADEQGYSFLDGDVGQILGRAAVDRGWVVASPHLSGSQWANDVAMTDFANLYAWANGRWNVERVVLHGTSAGALAVSVAAGQGIFPNLAAMVTIDGVYNLQNWYGSGASRKASVDAAWGTTTLEELQTLIPGHDPVNDPATNWAGLPIFMAASPADTVVAKVRHSDEFYGRAATPEEITYTTTSGGHVVPANYLFPQTIAWLDARVPPYSGGSGGGTVTPPPLSSGSNLRATDGSPVVLRSTAGDVVSLSPA